MGARPGHPRSCGLDFILHTAGAHEVFVQSPDSADPPHLRLLHQVLLGLLPASLWGYSSHLTVLLSHL